MTEAKGKLSAEWCKAVVWAAQRVVDWLWTAPEARELAAACLVANLVGSVEPHALVLPWMLYCIVGGLVMLLSGSVRAIVHCVTASAGLAVAILAGYVWYAPERYLPAWVLVP